MTDACERTTHTHTHARIHLCGRRTLVTYRLAIFTVYIQVSVRSQCWISQRPVHCGQSTLCTQQLRQNAVRCQWPPVCRRPPKHQTTANNEQFATSNETPECNDKVGIQYRLFRVGHIAVRLVLISLRSQIWWQKRQNFKPTSVQAGAGFR